MPFASTVGGERFRFASTRDLLCRAGEPKRLDQALGLSARSEPERIAARAALADVVLSDFVREPVLPPENDDVSHTLALAHDPEAFALIAGLTVGQFRDCLLTDETCGLAIDRLRGGITPEIASAVAKLLSNKDLILVASKIHNQTRLRSTLGGADTLHIRITVASNSGTECQLVASILEGLVYGCGDAVITAAPANPDAHAVHSQLACIRELIDHCAVPTQLACRAPLDAQLDAIEAGAPLDLLKVELAGTRTANHALGLQLELLHEGRDRLLERHRARDGGRLGPHVLLFRTGQSRQFPEEHRHGIDCQTLEARALALARTFDPLHVVTTVGPGRTIQPAVPSEGGSSVVQGPLCDRELVRSALEDHFMGKLLGLSIGCDLCSGTPPGASSTAPDRNTVDNVITLLLAAGCDSIAGSPCNAQASLQYQSSSFHDAVSLRHLFGRKPAPEFAAWLERRGLFAKGKLVWGDGRCQEQLLSLAGRFASPRTPAPKG